MITLTNDFHGTECRVRMPADGILNPSTVRRARAKLCGCEGCTCAQSPLGTRGRQPRIYTELADGSVLVEFAD